MEPVTIQLREPIVAHDETVTEITVAPPRAKDMRQLSLRSPDVGFILDLAAIMTGLPPSSIDQLSAADTMRLTEVIGGFLAPDTGVKRPS